MAQVSPPSKILLDADDLVIPIKNTLAGAPNILAVAGDFGGDGTVQIASDAVDGNLQTKYLNKARDGSNSPGLHSGLVVSPALAAR